jgi:PAS domain S-box-containing protein
MASLEKCRVFPAAAERGIAMKDDDIDRPISLLLVEDDPESGQALKNMLDKRQISTLMVEDAEDAFGAFKTGHFDVIVADIRLKGKSGIDLLGEIREEDTDFPVILLTGFDSLESAIQAVRLGAQDYILKPLDTIDDLLAPVKKVVHTHRLLLRTRALEQRLRDSEARFRAVLENSIDIIFRLNIRTGVFDYVSPSVQSVLGYDAGSVETMEVARLAELLHPDDRETAYRLVDRIKAYRAGHEAPPLLECRIKTSSHEYRWISATYAVLLGADQTPEILVGSIRDISEKRQAERREAELQERLERVKRVETLSVLASSIAHDLNNLMFPIAELPDMVLRELDKFGEREALLGVRADVLSIRNSARTVVKLVRNMLVLGRRGNYDLRPTSLTEALEEYFLSASFLSLSAARPAVLVDRRLSPALARIQGSKIHLLEVIMNLIGVIATS